MPQPTLNAGRSLNLPFRHNNHNNNHPHTKPAATSSSSTASAINDREASPDDKDRTQSTQRTRERRPSKSGTTMDALFHKDKRKNLVGSIGTRSLSPATRNAGKDGKSPKVVEAPKPATLAVDMESPPLVFYGAPGQSSGALLSGQLILTVTDPNVRLEAFVMTLSATIATKRPVAKDCSECAAKTNNLFTWRFLSEPNSFRKGTHKFPFSYLLPGHLPATAHADLGTIDYILDACATTAGNETITVTRNLIIQRALMPGLDKNSIRIFPPTNLATTVLLPSVIHPIGKFPVQLRLEGVIDNSLKTLQRRWRIRKINWRIEETTKIISAACTKHAHKIGGEGKGILHEETRSIGADEEKTGWKTDFDCPGGLIEFEFIAACKPNTSRPLVCDVESPTGLVCRHNLILELIVAEEQVQTPSPNGTPSKSKAAIPTGAARVLRMQFKLVLTERAGMGISWDEEQPPMYEDVPRSPPGYTTMEDWTGELPEVPEYDELSRGDYQGQGQVVAMASAPARSSPPSSSSSAGGPSTTTATGSVVANGPVSTTVGAIAGATTPTPLRTTTATSATTPAVATT